MKSGATEEEQCGGMLCESDLHCTDLSGLEVEPYGCQGRTARRNECNQDGR